MPGVFLFYLLCAITDCPPPVLRDSPRPSGATDNWNLLRPFMRAGVPYGDTRFPRSPSSANNILESPDYPVVSTELGDVQGRFEWSRDQRKIAVFEGIPYASSPVGRLRFRDPLPLNKVPWQGGFLVANKTRTDCLQLDFTKTMQVRGAEDCLYLNIYAPAESLKKSEPLPVIIWVHGGGWMSHSGTVYGPRYLLDKNLILVTFNYRLGVLGFLSTGDASSRGNFALKDQLAAFNWVVDHISNFGGNRKKITLMGESTGAGSVGLHLISPLTSSQIPRFHGAILFSGSSFNHWATMNNDTISNTKLLARRMHCHSESSQELVECLRRRDPYMVVGQQFLLWKVPVIARLLFGPVVEENHPAAFLVESPQDSYQSSSKVMPVPVISGVNKDEGSIFAANLYLVPFIFSAINAKWAEMMGYLMQYDNIPGVNTTEISSKISQFYFNGRMKWSYKNLDGIRKVLGDRAITTGVHTFLQKHSELAPTYGYMFTHSSNISLMKYAGMMSNDWGVSHGDELPFIFSMKELFGELTSPDDMKVSRFLVDVIANFAEDGQPLPGNRVSSKVTWSPVLNPKYIEVLEIGKENRNAPFPYMDRMKFWEKLKLK